MAEVEEILLQVLAFAGAFLLGGVSPGYLIVKRWRGVDVRATGSGKTGATNVGRLLGKRAAAAVLVLDALKAMLPVAAMQVFAPELTGSVAIGIVAGHVWPPFLGFHGGRGVTPAVGELILLSPAMLGGLAGVFLVSYAVLRNRHLAAMASFATLGIASALLVHAHPDAIAIAAVAFVVAVAHIKFKGEAR